ncbi:MAG: sensor histidine kinase [Bacteroidia bacterium]|nr:sensor histidine kinase [Bacteroidia bacterium]
MNIWIILVAGLGYLGLLFGIAYWSERRGQMGKSVVNNPYVYALSLAVYCTAWTFYGSVGRACTAGVSFLAIYLGPTLMAPLWYIILRKLIVIARSQHISSIADFISSRYGKSTFLGGLVSLIAIVAIIPYISLQLKAISFSLDILRAGPVLLASGAPWTDTALYVTIILAIFTILFGTRHLNPAERHEGLVAAVAFESIVKLIAFLSVGIFVTWGIYQGPGDLFGQAAAIPELAKLFTMEEAALSPWSWCWLILVSMLAILTLPRQFHVAVIENTDVRHLTKAIWLFPLYMLLINLFVLPIAIGGDMVFSGQGFDGDTFVLKLPLAYGREWLALLVFIGGLSASTSMVIVSTIALSIMASNNLVVPLLLWSPVRNPLGGQDISRYLLLIRRVIIGMILMLAYWYFATIGAGTPLVSIGLISFTGVSQFAPAMLGGLFWREGTRTGALAGLLAGCIVWAFMLPFPSLIEAGRFPAEILTTGLGGISWLNPHAFLGVKGMDPISHAAFWSLLINTGLYVSVSLMTRHDAIGHAQAQLFVNIYRYVSGTRDARSSYGKASMQDIRILLHRFLGRDRADELVTMFFRGKPVQPETLTEAPPELIAYAEKLLGGAVGSASAYLLVSSVVKDTPLSVGEVIDVLSETQQILSYSRALEQQSAELEQASAKLHLANERLREMDRTKDDFIATVTHELRTPITSIRSLVSIMHDNPALPEDKRQEFLGIALRESERISRLINQVLDLEKMESGHARWNMTELDMVALIQTSLEGFQEICTQRGIQLHVTLPARVRPFTGDRDRLIQVMVNLMSNAIKFCHETRGEIHVSLEEAGHQLLIRVQDNGVGIEPEFQPYIFDKFTQFNDYRTGRATGSGLGLSITWRIVRVHKGDIRVSSEPGQGAVFEVRLPLSAGAVQPMATPSYNRVKT